MTEPSGIQSDVPGLLVNARDIGVRRGERWIIRHVDLKVTRGELVYLIGANGAGKSTCLKAVLGLLDVDEGHVARAPSLEVGYVPQRLPVTPTLPLTLRRLMTLTGRFAADRIDAALSAVGLERLGDPPVTTPSGRGVPRLLPAAAVHHAAAPPRRSPPCRAASSSGYSWRRRSFTARTCWCWTNRNRASTPPARMSCTS